MKNKAEKSDEKAKPVAVATVAVPAADNKSVKKTSPQKTAPTGKKVSKKTAVEPTAASVAQSPMLCTTSFPKATLPSCGSVRVLIENIRPSVDAGLFPLKRIVGEAIIAEADVFSDGHDTVIALLRYKHRSHQAWTETPMEFLGNDHWRATFKLDQEGIYDYTVVAWVDHLLSWLSGFRKKAESQAELGVELLIGANLLESAAPRASKEVADKIEEFVLRLRNAELPEEERKNLALSNEFAQLAAALPDRNHEATYSPIPSVIVERERARYSAWYELFPRSWGSEPGKHGTFKDCERVLPDVARMGFNVLYLPPIHPIGVAYRKGKNNTLVTEPGDVGSPWAIGSAEGGHKAVHPELGTLADFKKFIKKSKEFGLEIALDIAFQCSPDHPYVKEHPQWFKWRPDGTVQYAENPPKKYQDVLPFNFETEDWEALWLELRSVFQFWAEQGVRIFRVDNPHTKTIDFWRWCIQSLKEEFPDTLFLSEAFTRPRLKYRLAKNGFSQGYTYFTWRHHKEEIQTYLTELTRSEVKDYFRPNFWPNTPDILMPELAHAGRPAFIARLILAATLSSNYGIYGPAYELCVSDLYHGKEEYAWSEKYELKWWDVNAHGNLREIIARINHIRERHPALHHTNNLSFVSNDNMSLISYIKATDDRSDIVLTVVNLDYYWAQSGHINLPLESLGIGSSETYTVHDMLAGGKYLWQGARNFIRLDPHVCPAHIFHLVKGG